jgi:hypothetical protein
VAAVTLAAPYLAVGGNAGGGATSTAFTVTTSTGPGDAIAVWATTNTGSVDAVTDSQGNVYAAQAEVTTTSLHGQWWAACNTKPLTAAVDTITVTPATITASRTITAFGCPGAACAAALDYRADNTASGTSASPSVTSGALVWKDEITLAGEVNGNTSGALTWTGTFAGALSDSQHPGTTEYAAAAARMTSVAWPSSATVTASGTITSGGWAMSVISLRAQTSLVGASIGSPASFFPGTPSMSQAMTSFDGWAGRPMAHNAVRYYYVPTATDGGWVASLGSNALNWISQGLKIVVSFKPGGTAHAKTPAEATNLANAIKLWQNAGANFDAILWHEPNTSSSGFTAAEYASYAAYYAPTVRGTSPQAAAAGIAPTALGYVPMLGTGSGPTAYACYPGDAVVDWISCDYYGSAYHSGVRLNAAQGSDPHSIQWRADNHSPMPVPLGLGEWNAGAGTQITLAEWNAYVTHLTTVFTGRFNCDLIFWMGNSAGCQDQIINGTDFKIPGPGPNACPVPAFSNAAGSGLQTFYDAVTAAPGGGAVVATAAAAAVTTAAAPAATIPAAVFAPAAPAAITAAAAAAAGARVPVTPPGTPAPPLPGYPQVIVEAAFDAAAPVAPPGTLILDDLVNGLLNAGILGDATTWTDLTAYLRSAAITRASTRVQGPLRTYQAGTAAITFDNASGDFDPANNAGLFTPYLQPMLQIRVRAIFGGTTYYLFSGFADAFTETPVEYDAGWSEVTVSATDGFKVLAGITLPATVSQGGGEQSGDRAARILTAAQWFTDHRRLDAGNSAVQGTAYGDTALGLLQLTADTEIGELYIDGAGNVVFRERLAILSDTRSAVPQAVFGDSPGTADPEGTELACAAISRATDDTTLANDVQITAAGSANMQQARDVASIAAYLFPRSYARSDVLTESDSEALLYAQWVLAVSLTGQNRFDTITLDPAADPAGLFPQVLGREIGDRIMVYRRPQNSATVIAKPCFIRGVTHGIDVGAGTWQTVWDLDDATQYTGFLILDDAAKGKVSSGNKLAY